MERIKIGGYWFNLSKELDKDLNNKRILYIPMFSMREYTSGLYDVAADGNVNRWIHKFSFLSYNTQIDITTPEINRIKNYDYLTKLTTYVDCRINFIESHDCYGENAGKTRINSNWLECVETQLNRKEYDIVLFEPNIIGLLSFQKATPIYWLPVSETKEVKPEFLATVSQIDKDNVAKYKTYVLSPGQQEYFPTAILDNYIFNPKLFKKLLPPLTSDENDVVVFHPFRQSDKGYESEFIFKTIQELEDEEDITIPVVYTAPNTFEAECNVRKKIKADKDKQSYYNYLYNMPVVIYLEDPNQILHTSIFEFAYFDVHLIYMKNSLFEGNYSSVYQTKFWLELENKNELNTTLMKLFS